MAGEVAGIDILIYLMLGSPTPTKTLIGGQRGATISHTTDVIDAKHKSSGAWANNIPSFLNWSIQGDAVIIEDDACRTALRAAWRNRELVQIEIDYPDGVTESGSATIADLSDNAPHDNVATMTINLTGNGELTEGTLP